MLKNYLKIALRNFRKHKIHAAINVSGLAIGMACCVLILLHVQDELRFDGFHQKAGRIHRVIEMRSAPDREDSHTAYHTGALAPAMATDFPEVTGAVRFFQVTRLTVKRGTTGQIVRDYFLSDPDFFNVFDFDLLQGDLRTALVEPRSVVLTETAAKAYFGEENPLGKMLEIEGEDFPEFGQDQFKVTGVLRDPPHNSHLNFNLLISAATIDLFEDRKRDLLSWESRFVLTYVLLEENASPAALQAKLGDFSRKYRGEEASRNRKLYLQPLKQIHFHSGHIQSEHNTHEGELAYAYLLAVIAFIIVLIACINYMNLATARAMSRAKEVGLRKVVGAFRKQLIWQFLGESFLTSFIALLLAIGLVELLLPKFNALAMKKLALEANAPLLLGLLAIVLLTGVVSGLYPAFYLARFQPALVLKGAKGAGARASRLRQGLVITQFALSIVMIVATMVVSEQLAYVRNKNLGFAQEHLVTVDINHDDVQADFLAMKSELLRDAHVRHVTVSSRVPGDWKSFRRLEVATESSAENETQSAYFNAIDEDFLATYKIDLVAGRNLSREMGTDSAAFILNEAAAAVLFYDSPLGKRLRVPSREFEGIVVGVVKDFHFQSLHRKISPLVMSLIPNSGRHPLHGIDYFTLRLSSANIQETIAFVTKVHERFDPVNPIELGFLESWLEQFYSNDARVGKIFGAAAGLAIFIACVGLFGLALFMAELRTKEIGIRKVLGASIGGVVLLLSKDFAKLVLIGMAAAIPIAWYAMNVWLQNFAYRIGIGWWVFALAGGMALVIALLTVSTQAIKASLANPVESLRYE